ncbi:MAG TPA: hypothetical protein VNS52_01690 [Gemmatimonadaceae bacterium]|nr:hypothetical protein [Gemmatimonadaceae bacterium]
MLSWIAAVAAGLVAGAVQYGARRRGGGGGSAGGAGARGPGATLGPAPLRVLAGTLLAALLLDAPAGRRHASAPFAALDVSASWLRAGDSAAYGRAVRAVRAARADSIFLTGDSVRSGAPPAAPGDPASRARPAVERALAAGRSLVLVTDGELDDPEALAELPAGSRVEVVTPAPRADLAVISLEAPRASVRGDTIEVRIGLAAGARGSAAGTLQLTLRAVGDAAPRVAATVPVDALAPFAERVVTARVPVTVPDGPALIGAVATAPGDAEPRNDSAAVSLDVAPAAGAVFVSTSPDEDARYAIAMLRGALALPTRAYLRVAPGAWRVEGTLAPVGEAEVRAAVRQAPLVVLHGDTAVFGAPRSAATSRGALALVVPPRASEGDWYATGAPASPLAPALSGLPWDSLPPLDVGATAPRGEWEGLETRLARRGERRVAVAGSERPRRVVVVAASGFWRWQFRAGASADAFAAFWGSVFDWLAAERTDARAALPADVLLRAGDPVRWRRGSGAAGDSVVRARLVRRGGPAGGDSLTLDFRGGATVVESAPLAPGIYDARLPGGDVVLAVNASRELLPRRATVRSGAVGGAPAVGAAPGLRSIGWVYALLVAALCGEWVMRRRLGMR